MLHKFSCQNRSSSFRPPAIFSTFLLLVFALCARIVPPGGNVGSLAGQFSVTANGGAHYSIPIIVPPGRQGAQPALALNYDSQAGNGIVGVGWSLSGLSAISRCAARKSASDFRGVVYNTEFDRFCLDGQMLIAVNGEYGQDGTEYRTERESWNRIYSHFDSDGKKCNNSPCSFSVLARDGSRLEFGGTYKSRINVEGQGGNGIRIWAANAATDRNGNTVRVNYEQDIEDQNYYPTEIQYTFNSAAGFDTARRKVVFTYNENRPDPIVARNGGATVRTSRLLERIETRLDDEQVHAYRLGYAPSPDTDRQLLQTVSFCGRNDSCMPPLQMKYTAAGQHDELFNQGTPSTLANNSYGKPRRFRTVDSNRDGLTDILIISPTSDKNDTKVFTFLSDRTTFTTPNASGSKIGGWKDFNRQKTISYLNGDVTQDGYPDLVSFWDDDGKAKSQLYKNNSGNGTLSSGCSSKMGSWYYANTVWRNYWLPMDFNNDGRMDIARVNLPKQATSQPQLQLYLADPADNCFRPAGSPVNVGYSIPTANQKPKYANRYYVIDANGDRIPDILNIYKKGDRTGAMVWTGHISARFPDSQIYFTAGRWKYRDLGQWEDLGSPKQHRYLTMDVNGDGLPELVEIYRVSEAQTGIQIYDNTGVEFQKNQEPLVIDGWWNVDTSRANRFIPMDYNGDGRTDLLRISFTGVPYFGGFDCAYGLPCNTRLDVYESNGQTFQHNGTHQNLGEWIDDQQFLVFDANGDGTSDLLQLKQSADSVEVIPYLNFPRSDLAREFTNGTGGGVTLTHAALTEPDVYQANETAPTDQDFEPRLPLSVVREYRDRDGWQNEYAFEYRYRGALMSRTRGWSGFQQTEMTDRQTGLVTRTKYYQTFPLTGSISTRERLSAAGQLLGRTVSIWTVNPALATDPYQVFVAYKTEDIQTNFNQDGSYSLEKEYGYDGAPDHRRISSITNRGDPSTTADDYKICYRFPLIYDANWKENFYPTAMRIQKGSGTCNTDYNTWQANSDLQLKRYYYDDNSNLLRVDVYDSGVAAWSKTYLTVDNTGNVTSVTNPLVQKMMIDFDQDQYYPVRTCSPPLKRRDPGISGAGEILSDASDVCKNNPSADHYVLATEYQYDDRYGLLLSETNQAGQVIHNIDPNGGIDDFGRVTHIQVLNPNDDTLSDVQTLAYYAPDRGAGLLAETRLRDEWNESDPADWLYEQTVTDGMARTRSNATGGPDGSRIINTTEYDAAGRLYRSSLPFYARDVKKVPHVWRTYDDRARPEKVIGPDTTKDSERLVGLEYAALSVTRTFPDPTGTATSTPTASSTGTTDRLGRIKTARGPDGGLSQYEYNRLGLRTKITDPLGQETVFTYTSLGQVKTVTQPESGLTTYTYDLAGNLTKIQQGTRTTTISPDALGREIQSTATQTGQPNIVVTSYYDRGENGAGQLSNVVMSDHDFQYGYDPLGNMITSRLRIDVDGDGEHENYDSAYRYDPLARLRQLTSPDGSQIEYAYHADGTLAEITRQDDANASEMMVARYDDYDAFGEAGTVTHGNGVVAAHTYDNIGRPYTTRVKSGSAVYRDYTYTWNNADKLLSIKDNRTSPTTNLSETLTYTNMGRLKSARGPYPGTDFTYDLNGNLKTKNNYTFTYDPAKKDQIKYAYPTASGPPAPDSAPYQADYDEAGNLTRQTPLSENSGGDLTAAASATDYIFDSRQTLSEIQKSDGTSTDTFTYTASGLLLVHKDLVNGINSYYIAPDYVVTRRGKDLEYTRTALGPRGPVYSQTLSGSGETLALGWYDNLNLASIAPLIETPAGFLLILLGYIIHLTGSMFLRAPGRSPPGRLRRRLLGFVYRHCPAPVARRMRRSLPARSATELYARPVRVFTALGLAVILLFTFINPGNLRAQTWPGGGDGYPATGSETYFHHDQVNSVILVTAADGQISSSLAYRPFGEVDAEHSTGKDDFRPKFSSRELIKNSKQYYFSARYYDPLMGRFTAPDPANQYSSPYVYADDDPYSRIDPDGQFAILIGVLVVGLVVGAYLGGAVANHSLNPVHWNWTSGRTWAGIFTGAALGVAVAATGGVLAGAAPVAGLTAGSIAFAALDVASLTFDSYQFSQERSAVNGIFLALDLIPFAGLLGRGAHGTLELAHGAENATEVTAHAAEAAEHAGQADHAMEAEHASDSAGGDDVCLLSFPAGTTIHTDEGTRPIETIEVGDRVLSYNESARKVEAKPVTRLFQRIATGLLVLSLGSQQLAPTPEHPFYVLDRGWTPAAELQVGDRLLQSDGQSVPVSSVTEHEGDVRVFNFEVAEHHNYFAGLAGVLVHNPHGCGKRDVGGLHGRTRKFSERGKVESDHFPAASTYKGTKFSRSRDRMPARTLAYQAHRNFITTGSSRASQKFRAAQSIKMQAGDFKGAMKMNISAYDKAGLLRTKSQKRATYAAMVAAVEEGLLKKKDLLELKSAFKL